jgi:hypothetical protein
MKFRCCFWGLFFIIMISSCSTDITGEGAIIDETYSITTNVTKVSVDHDIDVRIKYGASKKVHVTGYENLLDYVKISATGGVIRIGMKPDYTYQNMNISAVVEMPTITAATATHAGNIEIDTFSTTLSTLSLTTSGSGNITSSAFLHVGTLSANISNSGSIDLYGYANSETIQLSGSGSFNGMGFYVSSATATNVGSGSISVNPKMYLDATIESSGNIYYKRDPIITSNITGSGLLIDAD